MIRRMARVRLTGRRTALPVTLDTLQDLELVQLAEPQLRPEAGPYRSHRAEPSALSEVLGGEARLENIRTVLGEVEATLAVLEKRASLPASAPNVEETCITLSGFLHWARLGRRLRPRVEALAERRLSLAEERAALLKYLPLLEGFADLLAAPERSRRLAAYQVMLSEDAPVAELEERIREFLGERVVLRDLPLAGGSTALLLLVGRNDADKVERLLDQAGIEQIPVPSGYAADSFAGAAPEMARRLREIPLTIALIDSEFQELAQAVGADLILGRAVLHDLAAELEAAPLLAETSRTFILEGWVPAGEVERLREEIARRCGDCVALEQVPPELWPPEEAPVSLHNPRWARPFEAVVGMLPLPHYGSVDPTPLVAVFFPLFFGLILGDVGYGLLAAAAGLLLMRRFGSGFGRTVGYIATAAGISAMLFGFAFGEAFGDAGHRLGLRPLVFNREEEPLVLLAVAVGLGYLHVLLGLLLGVISQRRSSRRHALASALTIVIVVVASLGGVAFLAGLGTAFVATAAVIVLLALVLLPVYGGVVAVVELISTVGNILSYTRLMALGTASVMLALVANQIGGTAGILGLLAALLLHAVNLVLGLFSPTIHSLRLHYVEFFGKFYRPGGTPYRPFGHWRPNSARSAT